jgi:hypothetical protein
MTSSEKAPQSASTAQQPGQSSTTRVYRELSPEEARERGIPIRNDLVISPVPRPGRSTQSER